MNELSFSLLDEHYTRWRSPLFAGMHKVISMPFCDYICVNIPLEDIWDYKHSELADIVCPFIKQASSMRYAWRDHLKRKLANCSLEMAIKPNADGKTLCDILNLNPLAAQIQLLIWYKEFLDKSDADSAFVDSVIQKVFFTVCMETASGRCQIDSRTRYLCDVAYRRYKLYESRNIPRGSYSSIYHHINEKFPGFICDLGYEEDLEKDECNKSLPANNMLMSEVLDYYYISEPAKSAISNDMPLCGCLALATLSYILIRAVLACFGC